MDPDSEPIDLTGYSVTFQVKDSEDGKVTCTTATVGSGIELDEPNGRITISIASTETKKFTYPKAYYQLQLNSGTKKTTILSGAIAVQKGVIN